MIIVFIFVGLIRCGSGVGHSPLQLYNHLFDSYNNKLRPVKNVTVATVVHLHPALYTIVQVDGAKESMDISYYLRMYWEDQYLIWDTKKFSNMTELKVPATVPWIPDIFVFESLQIESIMEDSQIAATIYSNGTIYTSLPFILKFHCNFDITMFPYDTQNCSLRFGSFSFQSTEVNLYPRFPSADLSYFTGNSEWTVISMLASRMGTVAQGDYIDLYYHIVMKRNPLYYIATLIVPSTLITTLSIIGLFSPFSSEGNRQEKVTMGLTSLLTMSILLLMVAGTMPKTSEALPLLGNYILVELILAALATVVTTVVLRCNQNALEMRKPPSRSRAASFNLIKEIVNGHASPHDHTPPQSQSDLQKINIAVAKITDILEAEEARKILVDEWRKYTQKIDMICMVIFLILDLIAFTVMLSLQN